MAIRDGTEAAGDGSVIRIDPRTNEIVAILGLGSSPEGGGPTGIAAASNAIWVSLPSMKSVVRIDPASNSVVATIPGFFCADGEVAADESSAWVADCNGVRRIDARTNAITRTIPIPSSTGFGVRGIALELGSVWAQAGPLVRIDPSSGVPNGVVPLAPVYVWGRTQSPPDSGRSGCVNRTRSSGSSRRPRQTRAANVEAWRRRIASHFRRGRCVSRSSPSCSR